MTLESIAWRGVHIELPGAGQRVMVYGPLLPFDPPTCEAIYTGPNEVAWTKPNGVALAGITHWAEMPTGAD